MYSLIIDLLVTEGTFYYCVEVNVSGMVTFTQIVGSYKKAALTMIVPTVLTSPITEKSCVVYAYNLLDIHFCSTQKMYLSMCGVPYVLSPDYHSFQFLPALSVILQVHFINYLLLNLELQ